VDAQASQGREGEQAATEAAAVTDQPAVSEEANLTAGWQPVRLGEAGTEALGVSWPGERPTERDSRYGREDEEREPWER
jgi:hypothetical protein